MGHLGDLGAPGVNLKATSRLWRLATIIPNGTYWFDRDLRIANPGLTYA
jgi:hypothetical protein